MATVSLIVPCYNMEKYINQCLDSILAQTYKDIQLIIVNDGSSDNSEQLILDRKTEIENTLAEFIYLKQKNGGVGDACNNAFKRVTGTYLILLDCDDTLIPESIEFQKEYLDTHPDFAVVRTNGWMIYEDGRDKELFIPESSPIVKTDIFEDLLMGYMNNWSGSYMIRVNVLDEVYPEREIYPSRGGQNLQFVLAPSYKRKVGYINKPLMNYTIRDDSASHFSQNTLRKQLIAMESYKDIREHIIHSICDPHDAELFQKKIDLRYARIYLSLASRLNDKERVKKEYEFLKAKDQVAMDDKIMYYDSLCPPLAKFYRIIGKVRRKIGRFFYSK